MFNSITFHKKTFGLYSTVISICGVLSLLFGIVEAQTITAKPIYKGAQSLSIIEMSGGGIFFGYQNDDYKTIVDIVSFSVDSKSKAIELIDKSIKVLNMEKTDKEQDIYDKFEDIRLIRFGFMQNRIILLNSKNNGLTLSLKDCNNIKAALLNYQYSNQIEN
jgi:hypothetical protein